jgi:hypothetical protein
VVALLEGAAFHGRPGDGIRALAGLDPDADAPARVRWLAGVCLGATGRYGAAARWLAPAGEPVDSLTASCLASHLRQVGRHAEAEPLDRLALATATSAEARADALTGLVADAVGQHDLDLARSRIGPATEQVVAVTSGDGAWRTRVRLNWVTAEAALLGSNPTAAIEFGRAAQRTSLKAMAWRHAVKSQLVLGVALAAAGRRRAAVRVLRTAAVGATRLDLVPLLSPTRAVLATTLPARPRRRPAANGAEPMRHKA